METQGKRFIWIHQAQIGLVGLDQALNKIIKGQQTGETEAVDALFETIQSQNYIPTHLAEQYREALRQELRRAQTGKSGAPQGLVIRILGKPCVSCSRLGTMVIEVLNKLNIAADVEQIHDPDEIWRYGLLNTPALIINNQLKSSGRLPSLTEIEELIREAALL